jgi:hypothetical protein
MSQAIYRSIYTAMIFQALLVACATPAMNSAPNAAQSGAGNTNNAGTNSASTWPLEEFCVRGQQLMARTQLTAQNVLHTDYDAFVLSKAEVRPLRTEQYHWYQDDARTQMKMISCKMKTADHLRTEYGDSAAGEEGTCAMLNEHTLQSVLAQLKGQRGIRVGYDRGRKVVFESEALTTMGPEWLAPYEIAWQGPDGALHIKSKAMRNDWLDPRYLNAPPRFRGTRYCHLIAPDYLRRLLSGITAAPPAPAAK